MEADATFIKEWGSANPAPLNIRGLHVQIKKNTDKVKEAKPASGAKGKGDDSKTSKTNFEYQITVQNSSTEDLPDMKLKYTIYKLFFPSSFLRNREKLKIAKSNMIPTLTDGGRSPHQRSCRALNEMMQNQENTYF